MNHKFLIHTPSDNVGVAVKDIAKGEKVLGVVIEDKNITVEVEAKDDIPIGHKISLKPIKSGELVVKYGIPIGVATRNISSGEHVHTHNLKSRRW